MILFLFHLAILFTGILAGRIYIPKHYSYLFRTVISVITGILISLPITYLLSVAFSASKDPLFIGVSLYTGGILGFIWLRRKSIFKRIYISTDIRFIDLIIICCCAFISWYIMSKTFKVDSQGVISVARNTVFDMGHSISIIRSMSWANNIPYTSPFVSGTDHLYHFMFQFWVAILEHFGVPLYIAFNGISALGFLLFLLVVYCIGKEFFGKTITGFHSIIFIVFHGGLMFIPFFQKYGLSPGAITRVPNYLFAGPFDGSIYSLFFTLNVFVNQRQLGFALSAFFILFIAAANESGHSHVNTKRLIFFAFLLGMFTLWHLVLAVGLLISICIALLMHREWKETFVFVSNSFLFSIIFVYSWLPSLGRGIVTLLHDGLGTSTQQIKSDTHGLLWFFYFIVANLGISFIFFCIGIGKERKTRNMFLPLFILVGIFTLISIPAGIIDQKFLNVFVVIFALFTAAGFEFLLRKKNIVAFIVVILFPFLILPGVIDFMVIKNDYLFRVEQTGNGTISDWIAKHTEKKAVFLSYKEIFDPVTLAGRKNYYGFFQQPYVFLTESDRIRGDKVRNVFDMTDEESLRYAVDDTGVDYILTPPPDKKDIQYSVDTRLLSKIFPVVYEDSDQVIFDVRKQYKLF